MLLFATWSAPDALVPLKPRVAVSRYFTVSQWIFSIFRLTGVWACPSAIMPAPCRDAASRQLARRTPDRR